MHTLNIPLKLSLRLLTTKKIFLLYDIENKTVTNFKLSSDLVRWRKSYNNFILIDQIKSQITNLTIKL
jgi:hypothetical protein